MLTSVNAVPPDALGSLEPGVEYSAANFLISHAKTVDSGSCAGCDVPVCLLVSKLVVTTTSNLSNLILLRGANGPSSAVATWQNGMAIGVSTDCCLTFMAACSLSSTPALGSTWGAVKALYR